MHNVINQSKMRNKHLLRYIQGISFNVMHNDHFLDCE